ncbi:unnamed protein product [Macrosiphum euphorbiae]|uniref:Amino acid transporter transmembrane domain-containing protein n=1 Tax=Macrosiphum euphorbiae TaxID=13131 RepID=A0AAV0W6I4_9HEMI|nr:unnamed protein product [Macrosiphum euphorbiae]
MSEGDVDSSCSCDDSSSRVEFESSMVSKTRVESESTMFSKTKPSPLSCTLQKSSSPVMHNFLNYDPPSHTSDDTYYSSFTYFVSRSAGLGFLCLPYAFKQVGVITGLALCFIAGLMFTHSFTTLVSAQMFSLEPPQKAALIKYKM